MLQNKSKSKLFLVATPIGNYKDFTIRAINILKSVNYIICEELKPARSLLSYFDINRDYILLNEHNEKDAAPEILQLLKDGKSAALISDAGTPLFSDPGHYLVDLCIKAEIDIVPVPGANSLILALIGSGMDIEKFYHYGWLSPKRKIRQKELLQLKNKKELISVMETPYRLRQLLQDVQKIFGRNLRIVVAYKLTMPEEKFYRGSVTEILQIAENKKLKGEFVLLIDNRK